MTEEFITQLLYKKYQSKENFCLNQVNTAPKYSLGNLILDFWYIKLDFNKNFSEGFEIKTSREDFLRDSKWPGYLNYCNKFYFVCPKDVIFKEELDPQIGLIYVYDTGKMKVVKSSVYRNVEPPSGIFKHILLTRLKKFEEKPLTVEDKIKLYINDKIDSRELGLNFRNKLVEEINELKNNRIKEEFKILPWKLIMEKYTPIQINNYIEKSYDSNSDKLNGKVKEIEVKLVELKEIIKNG